MKFSLPLLLSLIFLLNGSSTSSELEAWTGMPNYSANISTPIRTAPTASHNTTTENCEFNNIPLYGKVKFVESFPDIKIQFVESFPDLKVKMVSSFPNDCGKWQIVESFPDFTVQVVESFPDLKVKLVESFPGMN